VGFEFILNKRNRKFAFSLGPEYTYGRARSYIYGKMHAVTGIFKFSYRFNKNISVIFEPLNVGLGYVFENGVNYPNLKLRWFGYYKRTLAPGLSIRF